MLKKKSKNKEFLSITKEIESQLEKVLENKKEEIEKELAEKIKVMREEAERKITQEKDEIQTEKKELTDYTALLTQLEKDGEDLRKKIDAQLEQITQHKAEIEKLVELITKKLVTLRELNQKLGTYRQGVDEKAILIAKQLEEKYGIKGKIPESSILKEEIAFDSDQEMERLNRIKKLLKPSEVLEPEEKAEEGEVPDQSVDEKD